MFIRLILIIALSFFVIYGLNYLDLADVGYSFQSVAVTAITLIVLGLLYRIFTKFLKVFLFIFVFLPLVALLTYYLYAYVTGVPMEMPAMDWIEKGTQWF